MGPSGSGKSTLMHCVAGLDTLTSGQVFIGDTDLGTLTDKQLTLLRRERIGFVFQAFNLVPTLTARENITLPLDARRPQARPGVVDERGRHGRARATGSRHRPIELSGGQQQRVAVARALVDPARHGLRRRAHGQPRLALRRRRCSQILRSAVDDMGQTVVMVTHDARAASYADRVLFLADGRIVDGSTARRSRRCSTRLKRLDVDR